MKKLTIQQMQEIAKSRGGECLSKEYINSGTKLLWVCKDGHQWKTNPDSIKAEHWCPKCGNKRTANARRLTIEELQQIAKSKKGKCLSTKYISAKNFLLFECERKHQWQAQPTKIKHGQWCPRCLSEIGENLCYHYFEHFFQTHFFKNRPKWLINSTGHLLELDGYNEELKLAFEYNGQQHYTYTKFFHTNQHFNEQQNNDQLKEKLCEQHNIRLIIIPYTIKYANIGEYILQQLKNHNITPPNLTIPNYLSFDIYPLRKLKELQEFARTKEGKCLSDKYISVKTSLLWECKEGHQWFANPSNIKSGKWCPKCAYKRAGQYHKLTIEKMQEIAKEKDGECLSLKYVNNHFKLAWRCSEGHQWWAEPNSIKNGDTWCLECARKKMGPKRLSIEEMQELAKNREGECLSEKYVNNHIKLLWQCKKGHRWHATPHCIKFGTWCPTCMRPNYPSQNKII